VLKDNRFAWSRNKQFWYMPRPWSHERRSQHVAGLVAGLRDLGHAFQIDNGGPAGAADPAPAPALGALGDGVLGRLPQIVANAAHAGSQPAGVDVDIEHDRPARPGAPSPHAPGQGRGR